MPSHPSRKPNRPIASPASLALSYGLGLDAVARQRLERGASHLHALGARATAEFLAELGATIGGQPAILRLLAEFQNRLTPSMIRAAAADRFPPRPIRQVAR